MWWEKSLLYSGSYTFHGLRKVLAMLKSMLKFGVAPLCSANLFHLFAIALLLAEALTDSIVDNVINVVLYSTYGDTSESSAPCLMLYLLPTKPIRRFLILLFIPIGCLWCVGRRTRKIQPLCTNFKHLLEEEKDELSKLQETLARSEKFYTYTLQVSLQRITMQIQNCWDCCYRRHILLYLWIAGCWLLLAVKHVQRSWNVCWNCDSWPFTAFRDANIWLWKSPTAVLERHQRGGSCKDFGRRPKSLLLSTLRSRSVSWGELVHLSDERYQTVLRSYSKRLRFYRLLPLKTGSRLWGRFNKLELPTWLRSPAIRLYIWLFGCCLKDALVQDLSKYRNLSEFFQRSLRPGIRPIDAASTLVSPVDGTVLHYGVVKKGVLEQVKDVTYSLKGFLGPLEEMLSFINVAAVKMEPMRFSIEGDCEVRNSVNDNLDTLDLDDFSYCQNLITNTGNQLYQCIVYLAPGDYHRFHSPTDWTVVCRRHFPGELFSVNPGFARWLQGLFNFNERAVYMGRWQHGFFSMTAVGATNVGSINVNFDKSLTTNMQSKWETGSFNSTVFITRQQNGVKLGKGDDFGTFNLGSTVVLLFEAPPTFEFHVEFGQKLIYGQGIGSCSGDACHMTATELDSVMSS